MLILTPDILDMCFILTQSIYSHNSIDTYSVTSEKGEGKGLVTSEIANIESSKGRQHLTKTPRALKSFLKGS